MPLHTSSCLRSGKTGKFGRKSKNMNNGKDKAVQLDDFLIYSDLSFYFFPVSKLFRLKKDRSGVFFHGR